MATVKIKGHIWIENSNGHLIGPGKKVLLEGIRDNGSIKIAARDMKMPYRHAWEMISDMNKVSGKPLVCKHVGGSNGGGSTITKDGEKLMEAYEKLMIAFERFKMDIIKTL